MRTLAVAAALTLGLTACGGEDADPGDGGGDGDTGTGTGGEAAADLDLVAEGTLTVCSDVPYPPFEDFDEASDTGYSGFDIDIVTEVADGLGLELAVVDSAFDGLQSGLSLNSGQCDVVASAMTITEEREANIDFSDGYYDSEQSLLVPEGSDIAGIGDLAGARVGVQTGTTGQAYAEENAPEAELVAFPSDAEMYQAIQANQVDALLQDLPVNLVHEQDGGFLIVEQYPTEEQYGLAMKEGNTALVEAVNGQLADMRESARYDELYDTYFSTEQE